MTSTLHCNATVLNSARRVARPGRIFDLARGRAVIPSLQLHLASPHTALHRHNRLRCRSNGDSLEVITDKKKISIDLEPQAEGEYCMPGEVLLDNESHEEFTILRVEVKDYPGLLRVCAWVLNGLQLTVQNARYDSPCRLPNIVLSSNAQNSDVMSSGSQLRMALPTMFSGSQMMPGAS